MKHSETYENLILAVDTSSKASSVALAEAGTVIASINIAGSAQTSRILFKEIESILSITGVDSDDIAVFAAVTGPGSFTGLRVGLAVVESMARTLSRPSIGVTAFDAVACSIGFPGKVAVLLEAGKGEVYCGTRTVDEDGKVTAEGRDRVGTLEDVIRTLQIEFANEKLSIGGSGLARYYADVVKLLGQADVEASRSLTRIEDWLLIRTTPFLASSTALLASARRLDSQSGSLRAYYIKPPDAQAKLNRASKAAGITIEPFQPADIDDVVRLETDSGLNSRGHDSYRAFALQNGAVLIVARDRGQPSGTGCIVGSATALLVAGELQFDNVVVEASCRRLGIGRQLMNQVLREGFARGATAAVLEVRSNSIAARALYEGLGFRVVGIRKDYYGNPREDGLTMVLKSEDWRAHQSEFTAT